MKKLLFLLISLFPIMGVNALSCYSTTYDSPFKIDSVNFPCSSIEGEVLTFYQNETDLKDYFRYTIDADKVATITVSKDLRFESGFKSGLVKVSDSKSTFIVYIENKAYVEPTKVTTTTTTSNEITYTVILDNNGDKDEKKCNVKKEGETCNVTLPNLETEGFKGWGSSNTCQDGKFGSTKVNQNITYYACYEKKEVEAQKELYLKTLKVLDNKNEEIKFGTFSIKKLDYEFKVLNEVDKLEIIATADDNVTIEYDGYENLVVGENNVIIKLTDENNITNEYKLKVTRLKEGETITNINYLSALVIGNYNINFNKDKFNYNLTIDKDINKLVINAVPLNEKHQVEYINNNNLENGSVIEINVLDGEDNVTTYKINIKKESNNILLYVAIGVILFLIIVLVILIIIKKNQRGKSINKEEPKNKNEANVEVLNI